MEKNIQDKKDKWLNGNYDDSSKKLNRKLAIENPNELIYAI